VCDYVYQKAVLLICSRVHIPSVGGGRKLHTRTVSAPV
jgi:hypothetical protein